MPGFPKPKVNYDYNTNAEIKALREYPQQPGKEDRAIPPKQANRLILATWNIANLGVQERRDKDYRLIAEIIGWFDLVALQEVNDNLRGLRAIQKHLDPNYRVLFSDPGGNRERFAFLYDSNKVSELEEVGQVTVPPTQLKDVKLPDVQKAFNGFDRNPYLGSFKAGRMTLLLADVHLYFGSSKEGKKGIERRCLEAYAVARWADLRHKSPNAYTPNIMALGDFNLPLAEKSDPIFRALTARGLHLPEHSTKVGGSNLSDDAHYDQMAVFPGAVEDAITKSGVFDFDGALFRDLWTAARPATFRSYVKYYLSDHRPLWAQMKV